MATTDGDRAIVLLVQLFVRPGRTAPFASAAGFEAYRADPELAALAPLRESAIARTEATVGTGGEPYAEDAGSPR